MSASIKKYRIFSNAITTIRAIFPQNGGCNELCTLPDGYTYISIPTETVLPTQPPEITIEDVTLTPDLRSEIKTASPIAQLISTRVVDQIRAHYSVNDELKLLRTQPSAEFEVYNAYVEDCRAEGREQLAALGL